MADYHKKAVMNLETAKNCIKEMLQNCFGEDYLFTTEEKLGTSDFAFKVDIMMANRTTSRKLFFEVKTQGPAGNAHERAYRCMMPGVLDRLRKGGELGISGSEDDTLPVYYPSSYRYFLWGMLERRQISC